MSNTIDRDDLAIRAAPRPNCYLCGSTGQLIHQGQSDRLFSALGSWSSRQCPEPGCRLVWLDPMPLSQDIFKAYRRYYTHEEDSDTASSGPAHRAWRAVKFAHWANHYGYDCRQGWMASCLARLLCALPLKRAKVNHEIRYLEAIPGGRLLDVGCGNGVWLQKMQELGWRVEGLDFDEAAVQTARGRGLAVRCGPIEAHHFSDASFHAVTLNHVIEHVPDPLMTLKECWRVLKPGGRLMVGTPNSASMTHRLFGQDWRGLEPPRHLHLFSPPALLRLIESAGFQRVYLHHEVSAYVIAESIRLRGRGTRSATRAAKLGTPFLAAIECGLVALKPSYADCITAIAIKSGHTEKGD
jgi:2-polyprenyl-3-methyl-5-hydroxy-6-metoxy-1,4-benzoquinol methylase